MKYFTFIRELDGRWFVELDDWQGSKDDLEMVMGADTMLDIMSQGENRVHLKLSEEPITHKYLLTFVKEEYDGATYELKSNLFTFNVWLCAVTKFVFGYYPKKIYIM